MNLAHHSGQAPVPQPFLHGQENRLATFGDDQPVRMQPGRGQSGREHIGPLDHPQYGTFQACGHARHEQAGRRAMLYLRPRRGNLMQAGKRQSTRWQIPVDCLGAKGQHRGLLLNLEYPRCRAMPFKLRDPQAQGSEISRGF